MQDNLNFSLLANVVQHETLQKILKNQKYNMPFGGIRIIIKL